MPNLPLHGLSIMQITPNCYPAFIHNNKIELVIVINSLKANPFETSYGTNNKSALMKTLDKLDCQCFKGAIELTGTSMKLFYTCTVRVLDSLLHLGSYKHIPLMPLVSAKS